MAVADKRISHLRTLKMAFALASAIVVTLLAGYSYAAQVFSLINCARLWLVGLSGIIVLAELAFRPQKKLECSLQDEIAKRQEAEQALSSRQSRSPRILSQAPVVVFSTDRAGRVTFLEGGELRSISLAREDAIGRRIWDVIPGSPGLDDSIHHVIVGGQATTHTITASGRITQVRISPRKDDEGQVTGTIGILTDVTEEVQEHERLLQATVAGAPVALFTADQRGIITFTAGKLLQDEVTAPSLIVGESVADAFVEADEFTDSLHRCLAGEACTAIFDIDGRALRTQLTPIFQEDGIQSGITGVATDVTEQKHTRRFLRALNQAARLMEQASTPDEVHAAASRAFRTTGSSCWVLLTDEKSENLYPVHLGCRSSAVEAIQKLTGHDIVETVIPVHGNDICDQVIWQKHTSLVPDIAEMLHRMLPDELKNQTLAIAHILDLSRVILAPLVVDNVVTGVLAVASPNLLSEDVPAVAALAHQMSAAWQKTALVQDIEMTLAQLRATEENLRRNERYLEALIENASEFVVLVESNGTIRMANRTAERLLASEAGSVIGKNLLESVHPDDLDDAISHIARLLQKSSDSVTLELRLTCQDGSYHTIEGQASSLQDDPAASGIVINARDITELRRRDEDSTERARLRQWLSESACGLGRLSTHSEIYSFIGEQLEKALGECAVLVNSYDPSANKLRVESVVAPGEAASEILSALRSVRFSLPEETKTQQGPMSGRLVQVSDGLESVCDPCLLTKLHGLLDSELADTQTYTIGLVGDDALLGTIIIVSPLKVTPTITNQIEVFSLQATTALQRAGAEATIRDFNWRLVKSNKKVARRTADLEAIHAISVALASHRGVQPVLQTIVGQVRSLLDVESCSILLPDEDSRDLVFFAATHDIAGMRVPAGQGIAFRVLEDGGPRVVQQVTTNPDHYAGVTVESGIPVQSLLATPLTIGERTIGVLEAVNKQEGRFTREDRDLAATLANHAALAIENARLYEEYQEQVRHREYAEQTLAEFNASLEDLVKRRAADLRGLYTLSEQVFLTHSLEEFVHLVLDNLSGTLPHDVAAGILVVEGRIELLVRPTRPLLPAVLGEIKGTLIGSFAAMNTLEPIRDLAAVEAQVVGTERYDTGQEPIQTIRSFVQVPIAVADEKGTAGIIYVADERENAFSEDHVTLLQSLGNQASQFLSVRRSEQSSREDATRYRTILDNQTELITRSLPDGRLLFVNDAFCHYFAKTEADLLNHRSIPSMPGEDLVKVLRMRDSLGPNEPAVSYSHRVLMPGGRTQWLEWTTRAIFDKENRLVEYQSVGHDITDRHQAVANLERQVKFERVIAQVSSLSVQLTSETLDQGISQVLRHIAEFTDADWCYLVAFSNCCTADETRLRSKDTMRVKGAYEWRAEGTTSLAEGFRDSSLEQFPWWMDQLRRTESASVTEVQNLPDEAGPEKDLWGSHSIRALTSAPLKKDGVMVGVIGLAFTIASGSSTDEQAALLKASGDVLVHALGRVQTQRHLETKLRNTHLLAKPNLQATSTLSSVEKDRTNDRRNIARLDEVQRRVHTVELVQGNLGDGDDTARVDVQSYLENLTRDLLRSFEGEATELSCELAVEDIELPIETAISCGLIVSELVSNALTHAFPDGGGGKIWVTLGRDDREVALTVRDNGVGLPEGLNVHNTRSRGLQLVKTLTEQLKGSLTTNGIQGAELDIRFPISLS